MTMTTGALERHQQANSKPELWSSWCVSAATTRVSVTEMLRYENQRERAAVHALVCLPVLTRSSAVRLLVVGVFDWLKTQQLVYLRWRPNCWVMQTLRKPFTVYFLRMSPGRCAALRCDVKEFEKPSAVTTQLVWSNHLKPTCSQSEPISTERLRTI